MNWNAVNVSGACLGVGLLGFVIGKVSQGGGSQSEEEALLARAREISQNPVISSRPAADDRSTSAERGRASSSREARTLEDRLGGMEEIIRGENALDRGRALLSWIDQLSPGEFAAAVDRFRSLGMTEGRMGEYAMLLTAWAEVDPLAALAYATEKTRGDMASGTILGAWASRDPEAAIQWAKANHQGEDANPHMVGIIRGLAENNQARATELLLEMPFGGKRGEALAAMLPHLMQLGPDGVRQWVENLSDERLKDGATGRLARQLADEDPAAAAAWLLASPGEASTRSVDNVFRAWAEKDKDAALNSFAGLPAGPVREQALHGLVVNEARSNPREAVALMNRYPDDISDRVVQHFVWTSFDQDPAVALSQVVRIENDRNRERMYRRALDSWVRRDESAARQWLETANLPENVARHFQQ